MIAAKFRFHGYGSLNYVYREGKTVRTKYCGLRYAANDRRAAFRAAVVVSKKIHKSAVGRNRIRRRVYEVIRELQPQISKPTDLVFTIFDEGVATMPRFELQTMITELLQKAHIISS